MKKFEWDKMKPEEILKVKGATGQQRDFSDKAGPVAVQMSMEDCQKACKEIGVEYKKGYESRVLKYVCSDESVDRMGDIIKQDGWNLENFKKNPVIMGFHDYGSFPVGNALSVGVVEGKLKMNILFADKDVSEDADKAFKMAQSGFMKAGSVGFNPTKFHMSTTEEQEKLGMGKYGLMFENSELMEFSVCGVPANANALQDSMSKSMLKKSDLKGFVREELLAEIKDVSPPDETVIIDKTVETEEPSTKEAVALEIKTQLAEMVKEASLTIPKAGAVLSKKNKESIKTAIEGMALAADALKSLLKTADTTQEEITPDAGNEDGEGTEEKTIIDIDLDTIGEPSEDEALYPEGSIINIQLED